MDSIDEAMDGSRSSTRAARGSGDGRISDDGSWNFQLAL
jgi:hypothetical protein